MNNRRLLLMTLCSLPVVAAAQCLPGDETALLLPAVQQAREAAARISVYGSRSLAQHLSVDSIPLEPGGSLSLAMADFNGDGVADLVVANASETAAGPRVRIFDGVTGAPHATLDPYPGFTGGVYVAVGDVNNDEVPDITVVGPGGGPHIKVFSGVDVDASAPTVLLDTEPLPDFAGGVSIAVGDINSDGTPDIILGAGPGQLPEVFVIDGKKGAVSRSFLAFENNYVGGVFVAAGDIDGDGTADIGVAAADAPPPEAGPHVIVFDGTTVLSTPGAPARLHELSPFPAGSEVHIEMVPATAGREGAEAVLHLAASDDQGIHFRTIRTRDERLLDTFIINEPAPGGAAAFATGASRVVICDSFETL